jgi:heat shock protein HspQ
LKVFWKHLRANVEELAYSAKLVKVLIGITDCDGGAAPSIYFDPGAVVHHKLHHYRGVVVGYDAHCEAGESWYLANKTQPSRKQPWYHVLVHASGGLSTYVAQSNLELERSGDPIDHPRIGCYFTEFKNGAYILTPNTKSGSST